MSKKLAEVAKVNITPPVGTPLAGYAARKDGVGPSEGEHDELYAQKLISLGLHHFFQHVVISEEAVLEIIKPFKMVTKELKFQPSEAVFVANKLDPDTLSANKAGVTSIILKF